MSRTIHVIGNGTSASAYKPSKGIKLTCNLPPFPVENAYATAMVDFKMMRAIHTRSIDVPGEWVLGARPHVYMEKNPDFKLKHAQQIKQFYRVLPKYVSNYTDFNCGHMCTHFAANELKGDVIHMYGFNSIFDFDLKSCTDFYLESDRGDHNNTRLTANWRPIWEGIFNEFSDTQFVLYHQHNKSKINLPKNVDVKLIKK